MTTAIQENSTLSVLLATYTAAARRLEKSRVTRGETEAGEAVCDALIEQMFEAQADTAALLLQKIRAIASHDAYRENIDLGAGPLSSIYRDVLNLIGDFEQ